MEMSDRRIEYRDWVSATSLIRALECLYRPLFTLGIYGENEDVGDGLHPLQTEGGIARVQWRMSQGVDAEAKWITSITDGLPEAEDNDPPETAILTLNAGQRSSVDNQRREAATITGMEAGHLAIYGGRLSGASGDGRRLVGEPDLLVRTGSTPGSWRYAPLELKWGRVFDPATGKANPKVMMQAVFYHSILEQHGWAADMVVLEQHLGPSEPYLVSSECFRSGAALLRELLEITARLEFSPKLAGPIEETGWCHQCSFVGSCKTKWRSPSGSVRNLGPFNASWERQLLSEGRGTSIGDLAERGVRDGDSLPFRRIIAKAAAVLSEDVSAPAISPGPKMRDPREEGYELEAFLDMEYATAPGDSDEAEVEQKPFIISLAVTDLNTGEESPIVSSNLRNSWERSYSWAEVASEILSLLRQATASIKEAPSEVSLQDVCFLTYGGSDRKILERAEVSTRSETLDVFNDYVRHLLFVETGESKSLRLHDVYNRLHPDAPVDKDLMIHGAVLAGDLSVDLQALGEERCRADVKMLRGIVRWIRVPGNVHHLDVGQA